MQWTHDQLLLNALKAKHRYPQFSLQQITYGGESGFSLSYSVSSSQSLLSLFSRFFLLESADYRIDTTVTPFSPCDWLLCHQLLLGPHCCYTCVLYILATWMVNKVWEELHPDNKVKYFVVFTHDHVKTCGHSLYLRFTINVQTVATEVGNFTPYQAMQFYNILNWEQKFCRVLHSQ